MKAILIAVLLMMGGTSYASSTRTVDADTLRSSDTTKTWPLPNVTGAVMISSGLVQETPSGTVNGSNAAFTLANTPGVAASVILMQDGIALIQGSGKDYTISGSSITMTVAPALGQSLYASYSKF